MSETLLTDWYQLTMLEAYQARGTMGTAVFELYARHLPPDRGFLVVAGLEQALTYLENLRFTPDDLDWLRSTRRLSDAFLQTLADFRFQGDVWAVPEGRVVFAGEPWLRVEAALPEAQFVESRLINLLHFSTLIATKAARCVVAAQGRPLVDFGMRRAHGAEAAVLAARAAVLSGFAGTATVEAARRFGLPLVGTMAHSYVQALGDEAAAFRHYAMTFPEATTLLIDTYDTARAAHTVADLVRKGVAVQAVRIDSGDLAAEAVKVRRILDAEGAAAVRIIVSGNLDEVAIEALVASGAPIDSLGVGTRLDTSADAPTLDAVYKLQSYAGEPRRKRSPGKETWPGAKQVYRRYDAQGRIESDRMALADEVGVDGEPLLACVMREGRRVGASPTVAQIALQAQADLARLPIAARRLHAPEPLQPTYSEAVRALATSADQALNDR
jgi:nicotinate phosphoribosyltransferase